MLNPQSDDKFYSEKVIRLPKISQSLSISRLQFDPLTYQQRKINLLHLVVSTNMQKINNQVIELWSKILTAVKNSKIILKVLSFPTIKFLKIF